jgi:YaiO family outer membrane protein
MLFLLVLLLLAGPAAPGALEAAPEPTGAHQAPPDSLSRVLSTRYTYEWVDGRRNWHNRGLSLELPLPLGTVVTSLSQRRRFGRGEAAGAAEYWVDLWGDAYGHVHVGLAPQALTIPRQHLGGALYEVFGTWEVAGRVEWRRYAATDVLMLSPQLARYAGSWYLRLRTAITEQGGTWSATQIAAARYQFGGPDSFVEGQLGYGRTVEVAGTALGALQPARSYFGSARLHHFFSPHLGTAVSATYSEGVYRRTGVSVGLLARW